MGLHPLLIVDVKSTKYVKHREWVYSEKLCSIRTFQSNDGMLKPAIKHVIRE